MGVWQLAADSLLEARSTYDEGARDAQTRRDKHRQAEQEQ